MLVGGDSFHTGQRTMMNMFDESYLELDMFVVLHHGINSYDYFTDYITPKTVLYPNYQVGSIWYGVPEGYRKANLETVEGNEHLVEVAEEVYSCENGTVVLTFPYKLGQAEILEPCDWKYTNGKRNKYPFAGVK